MPADIHDTETACCPTATAAIGGGSVVVSIGCVHHTITVDEAANLMVDLGYAVGECRFEESAGVPVGRPDVVIEQE